MFFLVTIKCEVKVYELHNENDKKAINTNIDWSKYSTALTWNCRKSVHSKLIVIFLFFFYCYSNRNLARQVQSMLLQNVHSFTIYTHDIGELTFEDFLPNAVKQLFVHEAQPLSLLSSNWLLFHLNATIQINVFLVCQRKFDVPKIENCPFNLEKVTRNCT